MARPAPTSYSRQRLESLNGHSRQRLHDAPIKMRGIMRCVHPDPAVAPPAPSVFRKAPMRDRINKATIRRPVAAGIPAPTQNGGLFEIIGDRSRNLI